MPIPGAFMVRVEKNNNSRLGYTYFYTEKSKCMMVGLYIIRTNDAYLISKLLLVLHSFETLM